MRYQIKVVIETDEETATLYKVTALLTSVMSLLQNTDLKTKITFNTSKQSVDLHSKTIHVNL